MEDLLDHLNSIEMNLRSLKLALKAGDHDGAQACFLEIRNDVECIDELDEWPMS